MAYCEKATSECSVMQKTEQMFLDSGVCNWFLKLVQIQMC